MEAFSNPGTATKFRRAVGRRFSHRLSTLPGKQGLRDRKQFEGRPPEETSARQHMPRTGNPYGFFPPGQELKRGTDFETASVPEAFLVSLDGPVSGMSSDAA